jgi:esterase/lipase superfamily enzyme
MAEIRVFFVTNRNLLDGAQADFGTHFNPDGVAALRFGEARFAVDGANYVPLGVEVYLEKFKHPAHFDPGGDPPLFGSQTFLDNLRAEMLDRKRDTLIFIHGFNVSFRKALADGARLANEIGRDINVVVFSWPSDGTWVPYMSYYSDREDARASGPALARAYLKLFDFVEALRKAEIERMKAEGKVDLTKSELCQRCIHLLAHSMGAYVLRQGIQAITAKDPKKLVRMFDQVVLAAPDEDDDTFELDEKLRILPTLARRITVYHNHNDRALIVSDITKANPDRLGADGPRMLDLLPKKVIIVDCSRIAPLADPLAQHSYYINNASVAADLSAVLADTADDAIGNRDIVRPERAYRIRG